MEQEAQSPTPVKPENFDQAKFEIEIKSLKTTSNGANDDLVCLVQYLMWCEIDGARRAFESEISFGPEQLALVENPIPFAELTESVVKSWVEQIAPLTHIKYSLCWQFLPDPLQRQLPGTQKSLPWAA